MAEKPTEAQRRVLSELVEGQAIYTAWGAKGTAWFGKTLRSVNWNTLEACRVRGWVAGTPELEVSGATYRITDAGRAALNPGADHG